MTAQPRRCHRHVNPEAVMFAAGPYGAADVPASLFIATPLHRLERLPPAEVCSGLS